MTGGPPGPRGSVAGWVARSGLYRLATTPPGPVAPILESAATLIALRRWPRVLPLLLAGGALLACAGAFTGNPPAALLGLTFAGAALLPRQALLALPALFIWGPRLNLAAAGDEILFLRLDQAAVAGLLAFAAFHPRGALRSPPAHTAFLAFLIALALSVAVGLARGALTTPLSSLLYLGQWLEFYAVYVLAFSLGPRIQGAAVYAWALPLIALAAYGLAEAAWPYYEVPGVRYRTFERVWFPGQANHAAGLFALATVSGLALAATARYRALGLSLALLSTLALWPTGSRSGALAWMAGIGALLLIAAPPARWWLPPLGIVALCAIPAAWWQRFAMPGSSMYDRLVAWKSALSTVDTYPLFGLGAGARHRSYYDNHYLMTLAESGAVGLACLLLLLVGIARALGHAEGGNPWWRLGALAGLAALSVHALATATFVVTLAAGPFFWYCGMVLAPADDQP